MFSVFFPTVLEGFDISSLIKEFCSFQRKKYIIFMLVKKNANDEKGKEKEEITKETE